ncbi:hypothetical protein L873DRAFT_253147 [Choiromyces venosus 120613-1]|uniref:Complex III subunit 9 n=1 Tax=Choiromyces venosus 120613-1 TaxID=1336337 RepID=A0A3N4J5P5_9PEZI|nr:hypothetical protein L873DRAFT_253147 [Choiromyces venosus 120613-1]
MHHPTYPPIKARKKKKKKKRKKKLTNQHSPNETRSSPLPTPIKSIHPTIKPNQTKQNLTLPSTPTPTPLTTTTMNHKLSQSIYNAIFRRNYVFVGAVFAGAFAFEIMFDQATDRIWDNINRGRQWKDIRARYVQED